MDAALQSRDSAPARMAGVWERRVLRATPVAVALAIVALALLNAADPLAATAVGVALFLLGVPHGAVEPQTDGPPRAVGLAYTARYLVAGAAVFALWWLAPILALLLFLALSAQHFGASEPYGSPFERAVIGLWVVSGSLLVYPAETLAIFETLTARPGALSGLVGAGQVMAASLLVALAGLAARRYQAGRLSRPLALRWLAAIALLILLPPVPAVAAYFLLMHSAPEAARLADQLGARPAAATVKVPSVVALIGGVAMVVGVVMGAVPLWAAAGLGVAFVMPHMVRV